MGQVSLKGIHKSYGKADVIRGIDLEVKDGEFLVFVGPSGCGKSTTLRMIAGLESISSGDIVIDGVRANDLRPSDRGAAMVFQSYALYPHMTVAENMGFALKMAGHNKAARAEQVNRAAEILRITDLLGRYPKDLSGGQRQRVAIGRAIVRKPKVFLFDEPLSNLDAALRMNMRIELSRLHKELGTTMIYVTHDQVEAMTMGDRIAVFNQGKVEQLGLPMDLYHRPANTFVAGFIGTPHINMFEKPVPATASVAHQALWNMLSQRFNGAAHSIGLRPEHLALMTAKELEEANRQGTSQNNAVATIEMAEHLGDSSIVYLRIDGVEGLISAKVSNGRIDHHAGQQVAIVPAVEQALAFGPTGQRIA